MRLGVESGSVAWVLVSGLPLSRWVLLDAPRTPHLPELRSLDTKELIVQRSRALSVPPPGPKLLRARVVLKVGGALVPRLGLPDSPCVGTVELVIRAPLAILSCPLGSTMV